MIGAVTRIVFGLGLLAGWLLGGLSPALPAWAQEPATGLEGRTRAGGAPQTLETLRAILAAQEQLTEQLKTARERLSTPEGEGQREEINRKINELSAKIAQAGQNFTEIVTGIDLADLEVKPKTELDWTAELKDILGPIIQELRSLTARPRELDRLRREAEEYRTRQAAIQRGLDNIKALQEEAAARAAGRREMGRSVADELARLEKEWQGYLQQTANDLTVVEHQLKEKETQKKPFFQSVQNVFAIFFRSRGRNLLAALLAALAVLAAFRYSHRLIYRYSPWHLKKSRPFYIRLGDVVYYVVTFLGASAAFLIVLYLYGDWVLLGLAFIFLFGLAWAARHGLVHFWHQTQLLLNLGPVREEERVVVGGLPWKVQTINLYTHLLNPALTGGLIRLPIKDLIGLRSRPSAPKEPWFPCREGDWVILADGTRGKVVLQSPETVELVLLGGSHRFYPTPDFLGQSPHNISMGFRLNVVFGLDYQHQAISTTEIPAKLDQALRQGLQARGYEDGLVNLKVEFKEAGPSSLDVEILADFRGGLAEQYEILGRLLQRLAVEACNQNHWVIPFTQVTIHQAAPPQGKDQP